MLTQNLQDKDHRLVESELNLQNQQANYDQKIDKLNQQVQELQTDHKQAMNKNNELQNLNLQII